MRDGADPRLHAFARLAGLALFALAACGPESRGPGSALLLTLDTTRADALGCYGARPSPTPHLDRLASEGVLYTAAHTVTPLTQPAHASILTGLYPLRHGIRDNGQAPLPPQAETVAEVASAAGYQTAAFVGGIVLDARFGLDQGFDVYQGPPTSGPERRIELPAAVVVDRAVAWLAARERKRPFFLWVHLFDPHAPYEPPHRFTDDDSEAGLYADEVRVMDEAIGELLAALESEGAADTLIVATSDHGEAFGEHGEKTHGVFCWETTMHVPMIVRHPNGYRRGERSTENASVVDVGPTLLEGMGLPPWDGVDGMSLFSGRLPEERGVYLESYTPLFTYGWSQQAGWIRGGLKVVHDTDSHLYDLPVDPGESRDLAPSRPDETARLEAAISTLAEAPRLDPELVEDRDEAMLSALHELGYASMARMPERLPHPLDTRGRPSALAHVDEYRSLEEAVALASAGRLRPAEELFEQVLEEDPGNLLALDRLANCRHGLGDVEGAIDAFGRYLEAGPQWAGSYVLLARWQIEAGQAEAALRSVRVADELRPDNPTVLSMLLRLTRETGRRAEALEIERRIEEVRARLAGADETKGGTERNSKGQGAAAGGS